MLYPFVSLGSVAYVSNFNVYDVALVENVFIADISVQIQQNTLKLIQFARGRCRKLHVVSYVVV